MEEYGRKKIEQGILLHLESYNDWKIDKWTDKLLNYENKEDFWYGVIVGNLLEKTRDFYKTLYNKDPDKEVWNDVWDLIAMHQNEIKEKISTW